MKIENETLLKGGFEFCPVCHGQLKIGHRTGCEFVEAIEAERERCALVAETIRARELKKYLRTNPYHLIAEEIRDTIRGNWKE